MPRRARIPTRWWARAVIVALFVIWMVNPSQGASLLLRPFLNMRSAVGSAINNSDSELLLRARMERLSSERAQLDQLIGALTGTKRLSDLETSLSRPILIARVLGRTVATPSNGWIIDKGARDELKISMPVVTEGGVMVGTVIDVGQTTAIVVGLTSDLSHVGVRRSHSPATIGVVDGDSDTGMKLRDVAKDVPLNPGEILVTSAIHRSIPEGLVVGFIDTLVNEPQQLFQEAVVRAVATMDDVSTVGVIIANP